MDTSKEQSRKRKDTGNARNTGTRKFLLIPPGAPVGIEEKIKEASDNDTEVIAEETSKVKPWSKTKALYRVEAPSKEYGSGNKRRKQLQVMRLAAKQGLNCTPFIQINWWKSEKACDALIDTGAYWSLLSSEMLTAEELEQMDPTSKECQGISGEEVQVMGMTWMSSWATTIVRW